MVLGLELSHEAEHTSKKGGCKAAKTLIPLPKKQMSCSQMQLSANVLHDQHSGFQEVSCRLVVNNAAEKQQT